MTAYPQDDGALGEEGILPAREIGGKARLGRCKNLSLVKDARRFDVESNACGTRHADCRLPRFLQVVLT